MKRKFFSLALMGMIAIAGVFTSCSSDDDAAPAAAVPAGSIQFDAGVDGFNATRALPTTSANYLSQVTNFAAWAFYSNTVSSFTAGDQYIGSGTTGIVIDGNLSGAWTHHTATDLAYWPKNTADKLNFYAITPASDASFTMADVGLSNGLHHLYANVTVPTTNSAQKDIMFAQATDQISTTNNKVVSMGFNHAMTQVVFTGTLASTNITATVGGIKVCNIKNTGKVGYLTDDGDNTVTLGVADVAYGTGATTADISFPIGVSATNSLTAYGTTYNLTAADGALLMLPQTTTAWNPASDSPKTIANANTNQKSYLDVTCTIKNGDTYLVGSASGHGHVYIPFAANWLQGKKYTYKLIFGTGEGGYDEDGNPLIEPISYTVSEPTAWDAVSDIDVSF